MLQSLQMTTAHILRDVKRAGKSLRSTRLYYVLGALKIKQVGARQRPAQYPADTADRILAHFGLATFANANGIHAVAERKFTPEPTMRELRNARAKTKGRK